ncbi:MAG TPA: hypothetical protein VGF69_26420 [Thermoanaerobaculia bacterium]|jgi:hypothetical protein
MKIVRSVAFVLSLGLLTANVLIGASAPAAEPQPCPQKYYDCLAGGGSAEYCEGLCPGNRFN